MYVPDFSSLATLEVAYKFVVWGGLGETTVSAQVLGTAMLQISIPAASSNPADKAGREALMSWCTSQDPPTFHRILLLTTEPSQFPSQTLQTTSALQKPGF